MLQEHVLVTLPGIVQNLQGPSSKNKKYRMTGTIQVKLYLTTVIALGCVLVECSLDIFCKR